MIKTQDHLQETWVTKAQYTSRSVTSTSIEALKWNFSPGLMETGRLKPSSQATVSWTMVLRDSQMEALLAVSALETNATVALNLWKRLLLTIQILVGMILVILATGSRVNTLVFIEICKLLILCVVGWDFLKNQIPQNLVSHQIVTLIWTNNFSKNESD